MQLLGWKLLVSPKKYRSYRVGINCNVPNVLDRQFRADQPKQKWVTDVTESFKCPLIGVSSLMGRAKPASTIANRG